MLLSVFQVRARAKVPCSCLSNTRCLWSPSPPFSYPACISSTVERTATLRCLVLAVERATGLPSHTQKILFRGRMLSEGALVADCGLSDGCIVHVASRASEEARKFPLSQHAQPSSRQHEESAPRPKLNKPPRVRSKKGGTKGWWSKLAGDDVISMEPLAELDYEPFELFAGAGEAGGQDAYNYFDGVYFPLLLFAKDSRFIVRFIVTLFLSSAFGPVPAFGAST